MEHETISRLYLELSQVVPRDTKTARELDLEFAIKTALCRMDHITPGERNGPFYQVADRLRGVLGHAPIEIGAKPSDGIDSASEPTHVLVPLEPTDRQLQAMHDGPLGADENHMDGATRAWLRAMYRAAIA